MTASSPPRVQVAYAGMVSRMIFVGVAPKCFQLADSDVRRLTLQANSEHFRTISTTSRRRGGVNVLFGEFV